VALSQEAHSDCKNLAYENRNQIESGPLLVSRIQGNAQDAQSLPITQACAGIFTEPDHMLIAVTQSDETGHFELDGIPDGTYRLLVNPGYGGFCPANAKLKLDHHAKTKKALNAQMRVAGTGACSWIELK
jgi:hypothetical protein